MTFDNATPVVESADTLLSKDDLDAPVTLKVVKWEGRLHCAYLNDHRIVGGKPWGGGTIAKEWKTTLREVIQAFPALQRALSIDYLGRAKANPDREALIAELVGAADEVLKYRVGNISSRTGYLRDNDLSREALEALEYWAAKARGQA